MINFYSQLFLVQGYWLFLSLPCSVTKHTTLLYERKPYELYRAVMCSSKLERGSRDNTYTGVWYTVVGARDKKWNSH